MIRGENDKSVLLVYPQTISATNLTASGTMDCVDFDQAQIEILLDTAATNPATMTLSECASSGGTFTAIGAFTGDDTTDGFTIPAIDTSNGCVVRMDVNLKKRKRYLKIAISPGVSQVMAVEGRLSRAHETPTTDAGLGCDEIVRA